MYKVRERNVLIKKILAFSNYYIMMNVILISQFKIKRFK